MQRVVFLHKPNCVWLHIFYVGNIRCSRLDGPTDVPPCRYLSCLSAHYLFTCQWCQSSRPLGVSSGLYVLLLGRLDRPPNAITSTSNTLHFSLCNNLTSGGAWIYAEGRLGSISPTPSPSGCQSIRLPPPPSSSSKGKYFILGMDSGTHGGWVGGLKTAHM